MPYQIDASHSEIQFSARHMMVSKVRGTFEKWSGTVALNAAHPEQTVVDVTIEAASINTRDAQRDGHLKSPDFLNVEAFPTVHFKSTRVEVTGREDDVLAVISKELTLECITMFHMDRRPKSDFTPTHTPNSSKLS